MIKKVIISGHGSTSGYFKLYKLGFQVPMNGTWTDAWLTVDETNFIQSTNRYFECTTFTAETDVDTYGIATANTKGWLEDLFNKDTTDWLCYKIAGDFTITITFKESIPAIRNVIYKLYGVNDIYGITKFEAYDDNDNLLLEDTTTWLKDGAENALPTPALETTSLYIVNSVGTIETTDVCHITNIYSLDSITPTQNTPDGTDIKYLLSFDNRQTYKTYSASGWKNVDVKDIMTKGMSIDEVKAISVNEYAQVLDSTHRTLDILVGLITTNETKTPMVNSIQVSYYKIY